MLPVNFNHGAQTFRIAAPVFLQRPGDHAADSEDARPVNGQAESEGNGIRPDKIAAEFKAEKKEPDQQAHEAAHHEAYEQQREKVRFPQF